MTNHTFTTQSSDQIEYKDGAKKTYFNFDLDAPSYTSSSNFLIDGQNPITKK